MDFSSIPDDEIIYVPENIEEAEKQMRQNNGKFSGNLVPRIKNAAVFKLMLLTEEMGALETWDTVLKKIKSSNIPVREEIYKKTTQWKKRPLKYFAAVYNEKTGDSPVMALVSRKTETTPFFVNHITTNSPIMSAPYVTMLLNTLDQIAQEQFNTTLSVPREYQPSQDQAIEVEGAPLEMNAEDVMVPPIK